MPFTPFAVHGLPAGGTTAQALAKLSNTSYDAGWTTPSSAGAPSLGLITPNGIGSSGSTLSRGALDWLPVYETTAVGVSSDPVSLWLQAAGGGLFDHLSIGGVGIAWTSPGVTIVVEDFVCYLAATDGSASMVLQTSGGPYSVTAPLAGVPFAVAGADWTVTSNDGGILTYTAATGRITTTTAKQFIVSLEAAAKLAA